MILSEHKQWLESHLTDPPTDQWREILDRGRVHYKTSLIGDLIERRFIKKEKAKKSYYEMDIARRTYYGWLDEVLNFYIIVCVKEGVVKLYD